MLRSDWGIVVVIAACLGLAVLALESAHNQQQQTIASYVYSKDGDLRPQQFAFPRAGIPATVESAISNPQPSSGQDHEKRDLAAQEASSTFAWWMVLISFFGFCVTSIATYLLYQQIRLTRNAVEDTARATEAMREANAIARSVAINDTRPIMTFKGMKNLSQMRGLFYLCGVWENIGKGPAKIIVLETVVHESSFEEGFDVDQAFAKFEPTSVDCNGVIVGHQTVMADPRSMSFYRTIFSKRVRVMLRMKYISALGDGGTVYTTEIIQNIFPKVEMAMAKAYIETLKYELANDLIDPTDIDTEKMSPNVVLTELPLTDEHKIVGVVDAPGIHGVRMT